MKKLITLPFIFLIIFTSFIFVSCNDDEEDTITPIIPEDTTSTCWVEKANLINERGLLGVAEVNDKIYAVGGNRWGNSLEEYDPATDTWTQKANMPSYRAYLTCSVVNGKIYAIAGYHDNSTLNTVEEYDPATDTWVKKADMPTKRWGANSCTIDDLIYVIGGANLWPHYVLIKQIDIYDPNTNVWTTSKDSIPTPRYFPSSCVVDGKIYVIGGYGPNGPTSLVEVYDPATGSWASKSSMPTKRWGHTICPVNNKIYAIAGADAYPPNIAYDIVEEYDIPGNTWVQGKLPLPDGRNGINAVALNGKIYIPGGSGKEDHYAYPELFVYDPICDTISP